MMREETGESMGMIHVEVKGPMTVPQVDALVRKELGDHFIFDVATFVKSPEKYIPKLTEPTKTCIRNFAIPVRLQHE